MKLMYENWRRFLKESQSLSLYIDDHQLDVEVASDQKNIQKGLMHRDKLSKDSGMLFIFPQEEERSFWMKNTKIPLSIAYLDKEGFILNIDDMTPNSTESVNSNGKAKYAIEVHQGWFDTKGIRPGARVEGIN